MKTRKTCTGAQAILGRQADGERIEIQGNSIAKTGIRCTALVGSHFAFVVDVVGLAKELSVLYDKKGQQIGSNRDRNNLFITYARYDYTTRTATSNQRRPDRAQAIFGEIAEPGSGVVEVPGPSSVLCPPSSVLRPQVFKVLTNCATQLTWLSPPTTTAIRNCANLDRRR
jgi:hypothetical protein